MRLSAAIVALLSMVVPAAAGCTLPADVSTRVGRAAGFTNYWTATQYATKLTTRDYFWDNQPNSLQGGRFAIQFPAGVFSSAYTDVYRIPANYSAFGTAAIIAPGVCDPAGGCLLSWYEANNPTWVMRAADKKTPAYAYGDATYIPLDISNPDVQSWMLANEHAPLMAAGYQGISVDNLSYNNVFGEVGVCSHSVNPAVGDCAANGGTWTAIYSGATSGDATFSANRIAWLQAIKTFVNALNGCVSANMHYDAAYAAQAAALIPLADIWFAEAQLGGDAIPAKCLPGSGGAAGGGYGDTGAAWIAAVNFIVGLRSGAGMPMIQEAAICPIGSYAKAGASTMFETIEFAVATYLLTKNANTYLYWYFAGTGPDGNSFWDETPTGSWPHFSLNHGAASEVMQVVGAVYKRDFANLRALVNPSTTAAASFALGGVYHRLDGDRKVGTIILPPTTGMVLIPGEPPGVVPAGS